MANLKLSTPVDGSDAPIGRLTALVFDPTADEITHLVVNADDVPGSERIVPIEHLARREPNRLTLDLHRHQFFDLDTFETARFLPRSQWRTTTNVPDEADWHLPLYSTEPAMTLAPHERIPKSQIALRRGTEVIDKNGRRLGHVDAFVVEPHSNEISHLIVEHRGLLRRDNTTIPVSSIDHMDEAAIRLSIDATAVEQLPHVPVHHHRG